MAPLRRLPVAIVGNGGAAAQAVLALRNCRYTDDIHLFADNNRPPYNPMLGPYLVQGTIPLEQAFPFGNGTVFYGANQVITHLGAAVVSLDAENQALTTAEGKTFTYDRCLVATGAYPSLPPVTGLREAVAQAGPGRRVFTLQTLSDALALKEAVVQVCEESLPRAAVVGASFAGVKIAAALHHLGVQVTLIEREPSLLPLSAHPECAHLLERHLLEQGYKLRLGAALAAVTPTSTGVRLDFGALPGTADPTGGGTACEDQETQQEVDLVVVCTGNRPALSFLAPGQVNMGVGILIDEQCRSSLPTLYAAGDVAQGKNLLSGRHEIIGLWSSARYQGRAAGRSLAGAPRDYRGNIPHNITHVGDIVFAGVGCVREYDRIETRQKGDNFMLSAWQEGRLVGLNLVGRCLEAGVLKQVVLKATIGAAAEAEMEATWTNFSAC